MIKTCSQVILAIRKKKIIVCEGKKIVLLLFFYFLKEEVLLVLDLQTWERNVGKCRDHNLRPFHWQLEKKIKKMEMYVCGKKKSSFIDLFILKKKKLY